MFFVRRTEKKYFREVVGTKWRSIADELVRSSDEESGLSFYI